uniref:Uncharacterized protein n=1 Tax=Marseillevirus LCMAC103 TaxID=2506604 RepID=A0A481YVS5_9VIRU|nr:MAG: hypothetical protein LCMAC103_03450 [Marseillevirus LCMAC103]
MLDRVAARGPPAYPADILGDLVPLPRTHY